MERQRQKRAEVEQSKRQIKTKRTNQLFLRWGTERNELYVKWYACPCSLSFLTRYWSRLHLDPITWSELWLRSTSLNINPSPIHHLWLPKQIITAPPTSPTALQTAAIWHKMHTKDHCSIWRYKHKKHNPSLFSSAGSERHDDVETETYGLRQGPGYPYLNWNTVQMVVNGMYLLYMWHKQMTCANWSREKKKQRRVKHKQDVCVREG